MTAIRTMPIVVATASDREAASGGRAREGDLRVIDREDGRDDRADHRRVRPVVHRPGAQLRPAQPQGLEGGDDPGFPVPRRSAVAGLLLHGVTPDRSIHDAADKPVTIPLALHAPADRFVRNRSRIDRPICTRNAARIDQCGSGCPRSAVRPSGTFARESASGSCSSTIVLPILARMARDPARLFECANVPILGSSNHETRDSRERADERDVASAG